MGLSVALQLYTVRDETAKDFIGTLEKVAKMGYKGVEFAGFGDVPAPKMKETLDRLGLKAVGCHSGLDTLKENIDELIEYSLVIGNEYIVCAWAPLKTKEDYENVVRLLDEIGEKCKNKGLKLAYHNHNFEFNMFDGEYGHDILFKGKRPEIMVAELDTCWVYYAGLDPADYIRKLKGRCPLVHLKDLKAKGVREFIELGDGVIDIASIVKASNECGAEWLIVEMDSCPRPTLESAQMCLDNLKKMKLA